MSEAPTTDQSSKRTDFTAGVNLISPYDVYGEAIPITEADCRMDPKTGLFERIPNRLGSYQVDPTIEISNRAKQLSVDIVSRLDPAWSKDRSKSYLTGCIATLALMRSADKAQLPADKERAKRILRTHQPTFCGWMQTMRSADPTFSVLSELDKVQLARDRLTRFNIDSQLEGLCESELIGLYEKRLVASAAEIAAHNAQASSSKQESVPSEIKDETREIAQRKESSQRANKATSVHTVDRCSDVADSERSVPE